MREILEALDHGRVEIAREQRRAQQSVTISREALPDLRAWVRGQMPGAYLPEDPADDELLLILLGVEVRFDPRLTGWRVKVVSRWS